jgi:hypothetical protein
VGRHESAGLRNGPPLTARRLSPVSFFEWPNPGRENARMPLVIPEWLGSNGIVLRVMGTFETGLLAFSTS